MIYASHRRLCATLAVAGALGLTAPVARAQMTGTGTPYQQNVNCMVPSGNTGCSATFSVPAGKTFVIQSVGAYRLGPNSSTANVFLEAEYQNSLATYPLVQIPVASATPFPGTTLALTGYAESGTASFVEIYRGSSSGQETDYFTVSGYLIKN